MKVTIYDVAREAGLSIATVSRVINGKGGVTPKSEKKIRDAIARLGYLPDASAQGLASSLVNTIGLVLANSASVSNSYYIRFLDGAEHAARERGFDLLLTSTFGTPEEFVRAIKTRHKVDGLVFPYADEYIRPFYKAGFPAVYAGHRYPWDEKRMHVYGGFSGYRKEALALLFSRGCRKVIYFNGIAGSARQSTDSRDQRVIEDFVITNGVEPGQVEYIFFDPDTLDLAYQALKEKFLSPDRPDGIFIVDDRSAPQIYTMLGQCGLRVPEDVKLVASIHNPLDGALLRPGLTAYLVNSYQMGYNAAVKLIQVIQGGIPDESLTYVPYSFIERESV